MTENPNRIKIAAAVAGGGALVALSAFAVGGGLAPAPASATGGAMQLGQTATSTVATTLASPSASPADKAAPYGKK